MPQIMWIVLDKCGVLCACWVSHWVLLCQIRLYNIRMITNITNCNLTDSFAWLILLKGGIRGYISFYLSHIKWNKYKIINK